MIKKQSLMRTMWLRALALITAGMIALTATPVQAIEAESTAKATIAVSDQKADDGNATDEKVFTEVEVDPEYPGGMNEMFAFVNKNLIYPQERAKPVS